ncbi:MAG: amidohydrolase family protein [Thermostichus sp. DG02_5_bins_236]
MSLHLQDGVVLAGPELIPHHCSHFEVNQDTLTRMELGDPAQSLEKGTWVILPAFTNSHTHMGDSCLPDGATGMTLEEGFFRPHGYKYRELAKQSRQQHLDHITAHLTYMAATGTIRHIDFREQGVYGCQLLQQAAAQTGIHSVILGQFDQLPFNSEQLQQNRDPLSPEAYQELQDILAVADGFSESTLNDLTEPAWRQIHQLTEQMGKLRAIHCLENEGYREVSLAISGRGDLERALDFYHPHLVIHATVANAAEIQLLSRHRVNVVLNPRANANLGLPLPPIAPLLASEANLLLGSDNGLLNSPNLLAELDFTYKVAKSQFGDAVHPDPVEILKMVTSNIRHLRPLLGSDVYGYLEVGLPADLVVLDFTRPHLQASRHVIASILTRVTPADVLMTMRQGKVLWGELSL